MERGVACLLLRHQVDGAVGGVEVLAHHAVVGMPVVLVPVCAEHGAGAPFIGPAVIQSHKQLFLLIRFNFRAVRILGGKFTRAGLLVIAR
jgi:hypothetical protein